MGPRVPGPWSPGPLFIPTPSCSDAQQLLAGITNFEFIVVFLTAHQYLSHLAGITVKLQKHALGVIEAYEEIKEIMRIYGNE